LRLWQLGRWSACQFGIFAEIFRQAVVPTSSPLVGAVNLHQLTKEFNPKTSRRVSQEYPDGRGFASLPGRLKLIGDLVDLL
jgi:hypothetical protein